MGFILSQALHAVFKSQLTINLWLHHKVHCSFAWLDHGFYRDLTKSRTAGSFSLPTYSYLDSHQSGDKNWIKLRGWERGGGLHPSLHPERSGLYLKQLTDHFLDTGGRPSSTVSIRIFSIRNCEKVTSSLWNKGVFTTADAKMGYRANWAMLQYWRWSIWFISVSPLTL